MRNSISTILNIGIGQVSVKATTTERLGFEGREEGVSAYAVVLLENCD
jgi:2-C-methyl-D-erythritol 2,4-cyclodiphosphate synthase